MPDGTHPGQGEIDGERKRGEIFVGVKPLRKRLGVRLKGESRKSGFR